MWAVRQESIQCLSKVYLTPLYTNLSVLILIFSVLVCVVVASLESIETTLYKCNLHRSTALRETFSVLNTLQCLVHLVRLWCQVRLLVQDHPSHYSYRKSNHIAVKPQCITIFRSKRIKPVKTLCQLKHQKNTRWSSFKGHERDTKHSKCDQSWGCLMLHVLQCKLQRGSH